MPGHLAAGAAVWAVAVQITVAGRVIGDGGDGLIVIDQTTLGQHLPQCTGAVNCAP
jgi:hypothetical protein